MKALVGAFNQEKALVGAFSVIVQPVVEPMEHYTALLQVMVATYRTNPKFGDVTQFEVELQSVTLRVQHSQAQVHSLARG